MIFFKEIINKCFTSVIRRTVIGALSPRDIHDNILLNFSIDVQIEYFLLMVMLILPEILFAAASSDSPPLPPGLLVLFLLLLLLDFDIDLLKVGDDRGHG